MRPSEITTANFIFSILYGTLGVFLYFKLGSEVVHDLFFVFPLTIVSLLFGTIFIRVSFMAMLYPLAFAGVLVGILSLLEGSWILFLAALLIGVLISGGLAKEGGYNGRPGLSVIVEEDETINYKKHNNNFTEQELASYAMPVIGLFFAGWKIYQQLK